MYILHTYSYMHVSHMRTYTSYVRFTYMRTYILAHRLHIFHMHTPTYMELYFTPEFEQVINIYSYRSGNQHNQEPRMLARWIGWPLRRLVAGFPPRRPGFKPGSGHVGFCDGQKWRWGRFGFPCQSTFHLLLCNHLHYHPRLAQ
jgi:hypothetical protein